MLTKATVIGTGGMGTICAQILAHNGCQVALLARRRDMVEELLYHRENRRHLPGFALSERIHPTDRAASALANAELVISAVPCQHLRATWERLGSLLPAGLPICSVTKGIEELTRARPSQIIDAYVGDNPIAVLSGPSLAPEIAKCLPATVVVAAADESVARTIQSSLSTSWFRVYTNSDLVGVEIAGALKNVIALAAGILDGLHAGDNAKAALVTRGLVEITRLGVALGGREVTFSGLAGIGDLVATCISPIGRNRSAGQRLGLGSPVSQVIAETPSVIEGIPTTRAALALAAEHEIEMPITQAVADVLFGGKAPLAAITDLMNRPPKPEAGA